MKVRPFEQAVDPLTRGQAWRQFASNSARLLANQGQTVLQDHPTLRRNSLIISTLVLVLSRIGIANASAIRANGTPEETHRKKEALKTTIRELGGWTLGYIVFRGIENGVKAYLRRALDFQTNRGSSFGKLARALKTEVEKLASRTPGDLKGRLSVPLSQKLVLMERGNGARALTQEAAEAAINKWRFGGLMNKVFDKLGHGAMRPLDKILSTYAALPLIVGGIPAIILSGYLLEWFTQNHASRLIDVVTRSKGQAGDEPAPTPKMPPSEAFDAYLRQIQSQRSARGNAPF